MRCLFVDEIFQPVVEFLYDRGKGKNSVVALACTAKAFTQTALGRIWRDIDSIDEFTPVLAANVPGGEVETFLNSSMFVRTISLPGRELL